MQPIRVFFSYSHRDAKHRKALDSHLALLKRSGKAIIWYDGEIKAGAHLDESIQRELDAADVVLLLVSSDFLSSEYCYCVELRRALERHNEGTAHVVPIIVRSCNWLPAPFGVLKALPSEGKAIASSRRRDEAYAEVATEIGNLVSNLALARAEKQQSTSVGVASPSLSKGQVEFRFEATPGTIVRGHGCQLSWSVNPTDQVLIDNGVGVVPSSGKRIVYPSITTEYVLRFRCGVESIEKSVIVRVVDSPSA